MILGSWPSCRKARLTKCALRHASIPTTQGGNFLKVSASASRLILRRKAILPSVLKPTMWKTSLPMSMPIDARESVVVSMGCFSVCCGVVSTDYPLGRGKQPVHPINGHVVLAAACQLLRDERTSLGRGPRSEFDRYC